MSPMLVKRFIALMDQISVLVSDALVVSIVAPIDQSLKLVPNPGLPEEAVARFKLLKRMTLPSRLEVLPCDAGSHIRRYVNMLFVETQLRSAGGTCYLLRKPF